jgi:ParB family chromosome partitioning protein
MKPRKLGRGLEDILVPPKKAAISPVIPTPPKEDRPRLKEPTPVPIVQTPIKQDIASSDKGVNWLHIESIIPNRFQPRKEFDPESLKELTDSVKSSGVIQPILVRQSGNQYELITGERRWRACRALNMTKVPAIIKEANDRTLLEWAIIENTQRKDLSPIERGRAYKQLAEAFHLTHEEVAARMGIERPTVSNFIRLLDLPLEVQEEVSRGTISMGHARNLLSIADKEIQLKLIKRIKKEGMSVRRLEYVIRYLKRKTKSTTPSSDNLYLKELEDRLRRRFGTKITISAYKSKGYISIAFFSNEDFQRVLELLEST